MSIRILAGLFLLLSTYLTTATADEANPAESEPPVRAVLVTGASTGIGRFTAERLASEGFFVYAGARKDADLAALDAMDNIKAVRLDVTSWDEINAAVAMIEKEGRGLWGVVNNAGVAGGGPMIEVPEEEIDFVFDVNVYGVYRVSKAFAPLLIESKGRIVNISSISGVLSGPAYGVYSMSKHAVEAMTDSMVDEFQMAGIELRVIAVEPGNFSTEIGTSICARRDESFFETDSRFPRWVSWTKKNCLQKEDEKESGSSNPEPHLVADAVFQALSTESPKDHYLVVPEEWQAEITMRKLIEEMIELNRDHEFSYTRDEIVEMLDQQLAGRLFWQTKGYEEQADSEDEAEDT